MRQQNQLRTTADEGKETTSRYVTREVRRRGDEGNHHSGEVVRAWNRRGDDQRARSDWTVTVTLQRLALSGHLKGGCRVWNSRTA